MSTTEPIESADIYGNNSFVMLLFAFQANKTMMNFNFVLQNVEIV